MHSQSIKSGFIALIGKPNVGKSTLLNRLVGQHISITTPKPQTTRNRIRGIIHEEGHQAVVLDTPGIHLPRSELHRRIVDYAVQSAAESDMVMLITEPLANGRRDIPTDDQLVLDQLDPFPSKMILVINKIDRSSAEQVLRSIFVWNQCYPFHETVPISALKGKGVDVLRRVLLESLPLGIPYYPTDQITDMPERVIAAELVREQIMKACFQEIPYGVAVVVEAFKEGAERIEVFATIYVEKDSQKKIVIGKNGHMLKTVGTHSRLKLERLLGIRVYLSLHVKLARNWVNNPKKLSEFGYHKI